MIILSGMFNALLDVNYGFFFIIIQSLIEYFFYKFNDKL